MMELTWRDELLFDLHAGVEHFGRSIMYVMANPPWAYTIGLELKLGHPELVVVGIDSDSAHRLLNGVGERAASGEVLEPGGSLALGKRLTVDIGSVHGEHWSCGRFQAWWAYHESRPLGRRPRAVQVLWPDNDGRSYWDPRFPSRLKRLQRLLSLPPRGGW